MSVMRILGPFNDYRSAGQAIGEECRGEIKEYIARFKPQFNKFLRSLDKQELMFSLIGKLRCAHERFIWELQGLSAGAGVNFKYLFLANCPELFDGSSGCTSVALKNEHGNFILHNEDDWDVREKRNYIYAQYSIPRGSELLPILYSSVMYPPELAGNAVSWNSFLFFCVDYLPSHNDLPFSGVPRYFEARGLAEKDSIDGALSYLRSFKNASAFHYTIGEFGTGRIISVEKVGNRVSVEEVNGFYAHTNHHRHPLFVAGAPTPRTNSLERMRLCGTEIGENADHEKALRAMITKLNRPMSPSDDSKTFFTACADLNEGDIDLY